MAKKPTTDMNLSGLRLQLMLGERGARIWALRQRGKTLAEVAEEFGISRERVRQIGERAQQTLEEWPDPNPWQASLPDYLRELCIAHELECRADLARIMAQDEPPARWGDSEVAVALRYLGAPPGFESVLSSISATLSALSAVRDELVQLASIDVIGAETVLTGLEAMRAHGRTAFIASVRDSMLAKSPAQTGEQA